MLEDESHVGLPRRRQVAEHECVPHDSPGSVHGEGTVLEVVLLVQPSTHLLAAKAAASFRDPPLWSTRERETTTERWGVSLEHGKNQGVASDARFGHQMRRRGTAIRG